MARRLHVLVQRQRLRYVPQDTPVPFLRRPAIPKVMCGYRLDSNLKNARGDVFMRVRATADEHSGYAGLRAIAAVMEIAHARIGVRGSRPDLPKRKDAPLRVAEGGQVPRCRGHLAGDSHEWLNKSCPENCSGGLSFFRFLRVRHRGKQNRCGEPADIFHGSSRYPDDCCARCEREPLLRPTNYESSLL